MTDRFQRLGIIGMTLVLLGSALVARATVMVEVPIERLVSEADVIVRGVVSRTGTQMVRRAGTLEPHSITEIRVLDTLKGSPRSQVTVQELGGQWQGGGLQIDGVPSFVHGEEVVLFLSAHPERSGHFRTYGMAQGKFRVQHGVPGVPSVVRRDMDGLAIARLEPNATTLEHPRPEPPQQLARLLERIRQLVGGQP